jgi:hypothetical protein
VAAAWALFELLELDARSCDFEEEEEDKPTVASLNSSEFSLGS